MFYISNEDTQKVHKRYADIREIAQDFFLEYLNNYLTTAKIAEHYEIEKGLAVQLIRLGKNVHIKQTNKED